MVFKKDCFDPDFEQHEKYRALYEEIFRNVYGNLSPLYEKINGIIGSNWD